MPQSSLARLRGRAGEAAAAAAYREKNYKLLETNYHSRYGEIDLILEKKNTIIFCEVKLRKNAAFATARENVTPAKQKKILLTALLWLQEKDLSDAVTRFDVAEVYMPEGQLPRVTLLENAFDASQLEK